MTDRDKILTVSCAAGATFAVAPVVYGVVRNSLPKPITDADRLKIENACFVGESGIPVTLRGVNLNDDIIFCKRNSSEISETVDEIYSAFKGRFGAYGARTLIGEYEKAFITESDLKHIRKLGANCVRIPLRHYLIFRKSDCRGEPILDNVNILVEKCRKLGMYVIFDLHSAPESIYDPGKQGYEARNTVVRFWSKLAAYYKDDPVIAGFDILNRPLNRIPDAEGKIDTLHRIYKRVFKAVRNIDEKRILIMESAGYTESLPDAGEYSGAQVAFGVYSHFHTTYETDALIRDFAKSEYSGIPFIVCKMRNEETREYTLEKLCENGISWLMGDFKGNAPMSRLYLGECEYAELDGETYDELIAKWKQAPLTKNYSESKEYAKLLKKYFACGAVKVKKEKKAHPEFKARLGFNIVKGMN